MDNNSESLSQQHSAVKSSMASTRSRKSVNDDAVEELMKPPSCCGICLASSCLRSMAIAALLFDITLCGILLYFMCRIMFDEDNDNRFQDSFIEISTSTDRKKIQNNFVWIMTFSSALLIYKIFVGVRWVLKKFSRPAMQTYYMVSFAFYPAFFVQATFILSFTWDVFNSTYRGLMSYSIALCIPLQVILTLQMNFMDRQHRALN